MTTFDLLADLDRDLHACELWEDERPEVERLLEIDFALALLWSNYVREMCRLHMEGGDDAIAWEAYGSRARDPGPWLRTCYEACRECWRCLAPTMALPPLPGLGLLMCDPL